MQKRKHTSEIFGLNTEPFNTPSIPQPSRQKIRHTLAKFEEIARDFTYLEIKKVIDFARFNIHKCGLIREIHIGTLSTPETCQTIRLSIAVFFLLSSKLVALSIRGWPKRRNVIIARVGYVVCPWRKPRAILSHAFSTVGRAVEKESGQPRRQPRGFLSRNTRAARSYANRGTEITGAAQLPDRLI